MRRGSHGARWSGVAILCAVTAAIAQQQSQQQQPTGGVHGTVVDSVTKQPVKRATINLTYSGTLPAPPAPGGSTDANGAFTIQGLAEGKWIVHASHPNYPQGSAPNAVTVEVKAGETAGSITLELTPGAVATGHVLDEDGDPMMGCFVAAHLASRPDQQRGGSPTNEAGEFRIHGLAAGKYVFSAQCQRPAFTPRPFSSGPDPPPGLAYPEQYYPLADAKSAQAVAVAAGTEKPGIDFHLRPALITQVRGAFSQSGVDWHGLPNMFLQLIPMDGGRQAQGASVDREKGTFEFTHVFPGAYYLVAVANGDPERQVSAFQRVEVKDQPLELSVALTHGVDVNGTVTLDDPNAKVDFHQLQVQLTPDNGIPMGVPPAQVNEDGTFSVKSVSGGHWRIHLNGPWVFLKSAWAGATEITATGFDAVAGLEPLRIVAGTKMGTISGTAPPGEMIYLATETTPFTWGGRTAQADASGRFTMDSVAPGNYRIGVMPPGSPVPDEGGQEITVHEGETVNVEIKPPGTNPQ